MKSNVERRQPRHLESLVVCLANSGYEGSLETRRIYRCLGKERVGRSNWLRVIDESGEDYLFPSSFFAGVKVALPAKRILVQQLRGAA
jgi:hypothetical protein